MSESDQAIYGVYVRCVCVCVCVCTRARDVCVCVCVYVWYPGDIRDTVGSWDVAFVVSGLMSLAAASCIFMEPLARHMLNRPIKASEPPVRDEML